MEKHRREAFPPGLISSAAVMEADATKPAQGYDAAFPPLGADGPAEIQKSRDGQTQYFEDAPVFFDGDGRLQDAGRAIVNETSEAPDEDIEEESFCMMSTPKQLKAMLEQTAQTLQTMEAHKLHLQAECEALWKEQEIGKQHRADSMARKQETDAISRFIADAEDDANKENEKLARELESMQEVLDRKGEELAGAQVELELKRSEFEKRDDVVALRREMAEDSVDFKGQVRQARDEFDKTLSQSEKKHQKTLQELRIQMGHLHRTESEKVVTDALKDELKEYDRKAEALKSEPSKPGKANVVDLKALNETAEELRKQIEKEIAERKQITEDNFKLTEESLRLESDGKGLRRRLDEVKLSTRVKHAAEKADLVEKYQERLAISESIAGSHMGTWQDDEMPYEEELTSQQRHEEVLRKQRELLEEHSRRGPSSSSSSAPTGMHQQGGTGSGQVGSSGQDEDDEQRAISEAEEANSREKRMMEDWIRRQCLDMGIDDPDTLDSEMREEMERAFRAR